MSEIFWNQQINVPLLGLMQWLPLIGAGLLHYFGERRGMVSLGRGLVVLELVLAFVLYRHYDATSSAMQLAERLDILGPLAYHAAVDGVSVLFIVLASLITFLVVIYSLVRGLADSVRLLAVVLAIEGVIISLLSTVNLLWFVLASAAEMVLVGYLLWYWATSPAKGQTLMRFFQFQATGLILLFLGALVVGWNYAEAHGIWSFDLMDLAGTPAPAALGSIAFFMIFYGLAIRTPLFPMHGWLPGVAHHGNVAVAPVLLLGVKIGIYGMVRFLLPILPEAAQHWHMYVAAFAAVGVFYTAILAFQQTNLRRLMAFAVVSHTSLVVIGLFTLHPLALQGSVLLAVNFGLAATAMLFMVGFVYRRTRSTRLDQLGGLFDRIPFIGITFLVGGLAIIGMPGTPGFDAAHMVLEASIETFGALPTVAAALGNVVAAGFLLYAFQRAFLAPRSEQSTQPEGHRAIERTSGMEYVVAGTVLFVLLATGFYLEPWQRLIEVPLHLMGARFGHGA